MDELDIIQRVELRFLLAKTDESLNSELDKFAVALIKKLNSPRSDVVRRVLEVLHFVKKRRIQSPAIVFPVDKLLELVHSTLFDAGTVRQNMQALAFIALAIVDGKSQIDPKNFAYGLRLDSQDSPAELRANVAEQFSLFVEALNNADSVPSVEDWDKDDLEVLEKRLAQIFLIDLKRFGLNRQPTLSPQDTAFLVDHGQKYGLEYPLNNEQKLSRTRKEILEFAIANSSQFKHVLLAATGDKLFDVSRKAHAQVMKLDGFNIGILQKWALSGTELLRTEVIDLMTRKRLFEEIEPQIIVRALASEDMKLRKSALLLLKDSSNRTWPLGVSDAFTQALQQYIVDDGWPQAPIHSATQTKLRQQCYELLGVFGGSEIIGSFLFPSLDRDVPEMAPSIQKGLSIALNRGTVNVEQSKLLGIMLHSSKSPMRYIAVRFAVAKLSVRDPVRATICMLGIDPSQNRPDVISESQRGLIIPTEADLPQFDVLFNSLVTNVVPRLRTSNAVETCLLLLMASLLRVPLPSGSSMSDLMTKIMMKSEDFEAATIRSPGFISYLKLLFSFILDERYFESVVNLLRSLLPKLQLEDLASFAQNNLSLNSITTVLEKSGASYGDFLAEYRPLFFPESKLSGGNNLQVLSRAYELAYSSGPADELVALALEQDNVEALKVLAVTRSIELPVDKASRLLINAPMVYACLGVHGTEEQRMDIINGLLGRNITGFDEMVANGEALSVAASGWTSKLLQDRYPFISGKHESESRWPTEGRTLSMVAAGIRGSPASRRIASVRLLCLTQYSFSKLSDIPGVVSGIQSCFMSLLNDRDEITQESAGRGLGILYDNGAEDRKLQKEMLSKLLNTFTDDTSARNAISGQLSEDTEVFEPGVLPNSPQESGSISTYKDVLSLANETGDNSLVYKFMSLSTSSRIWAGRKGLAFSLEQIMAKSELGERVLNDTSLGKRLVPKLFRYLYDPVEVTQRAMKQIWTALIPGSLRSRVIRLYLSDITTELNKAVVDREWRVREASAGALSELVSLGYLDDSIDLWRAGFRLVDDIKDSVRSAGSEFLKTLTSALIRASNSGKTADLSEIVPFLLKSLNTESTRAFSLDTLLKLSETSAFKPFAAMVLEELVLQLSSLEPQALNYLALNMKQSVVDEARAKGLRGSPIMQNLEAMVERGSPSLPELWDLLPRLVKRSVGVVTKLAVAQLIVLACMISYGADKPVTASLLTATYPELWTKNDVMTQAFANALGYMARKMPLTLLVEYLEQLTQKFMHSESDDNYTRANVGLALKAMSLGASDAFGSVANVALPLAFIGQFSFDATYLSDDKLKPNPFRDVWEANTAGPASLQFYQTEIVSLAARVLQDSNSRVLKLAAGRAISSVLATKSSIRAEDAKSLTSTLLANMAGRSWPGKEHIFAAMVKAYPMVSSSPDLTSKIEERVMNEIQRRNREYKLAILPDASRLLRHLDENHVSAQLEEQLTDALSDVLSDDSDSSIEAFQAVFENLQRKEHITSISEIGLLKESWKVRVAMSQAFRKRDFNAEAWHSLTKVSADDEKYEIVRLEWARTAVHFKTEALVVTDVNRRLPKEGSTVVKTELQLVLA